MATSDVELSVGLKADNVEAAAEKLRQDLAKLFKEVEGKPTNDRINSLLASLKTADEMMADLIADIDNKLLSAGEMAPDYSKTIDDINEARLKLEKLTEHLNTENAALERLKLGLANLPLDGNGRTTYEQAQQAIKAWTDTYIELDKSLTTVKSRMDYLQTAIEENKNVIGGLYYAADRLNEPELWRQWSKQVDYVNALKAEYQKLIPEYTQITQRQEQYNAEAEKYAEAMNKVYISTNRAYSPRNTDRILFVQSQIKETTGSINKQTAALDRLEKKKSRLKEEKLDFTNIENVKEARGLISELDSVVNAATINANKLNREFEKMPQFVDSTKGSVRSLSEMLIQAFRAAGTAIENTLDGVVRTMPPIFQVAYGVVKAGVKLIIGEIINTAKQVAGVIKNTVIKALNIATTAAKNFAKTLAKVASNTLLSPLKKFGDVIGGIGKKATESDFSMKKFSRAILQYGIGVRSLYRLINKLRTALFEGFADLALAYEPFNDSMSQIITALNYLKNSFAAAFAPIIEYIAPVLSIFVTKIAEAVQWIGQLIAALTGKEFVMALPVFKDYSEETKAGAAAAREQAQAEKQAKKAAEDEAKAEKKRNKALEKLQRTIAGFDDVELLKDNTKDDDNYGFDPDKYDFSTPTLDAALQTFKVGGPIQAGIQQFADLLKKAWKTANAYNLGQLLSEQFKNLLQQFWRTLPQIQEFFSKVARTIASFIAGFLSVEDTFKWLGLAIAGIINTIFKTVQEFLTTFINLDGFKNLGKAIYNVITVALANINWETIYDVFRMLGIGIAQVLNETIAQPGFWISIFDALCNALRAVAIQIKSFAQELHWDEIGQAVADGIIYFFNNFPYEEVSQAIKAFLGGLWTLFINFVTEMDGHWYEIGNNIASFIISLFEDFEPVEFANGVISFLDGLWETFMGFVETPGWDEVVDKVGTAIATFLNKFKWEEKADDLVAFLNNAITKLKELVDKLQIRELIDRLITWLKTNPEVRKLVNSIVDIIIEFTLLQIQVKLELFKLIGAKILTLIIDGLIDFIASGGLVGMAVNSLINAITNAVNANKTGNINTGAEIGAAIDDGLSGETDTIASTAASIDAAIQEGLSSDNYKLIMTDNTKGANEALSNFRSEATGTVSTASAEMQAALASGNWEEVMRVNVQNGATGISNNSYLVTDEVGTMTQSISDIFTNMDWSIIGNGLIDGIYYGLSNGWGWLCDTVWNLATDLLNSAKNALGIASPSKVFREAVGKMIPAGIGIGIEANADSALGAVDDLSTGLVKTAKNIKIPPIAMGEVIPYNIANGQNNSTQATLKSLADMIQLQQREMVTNESLMRAIALIIENMPDFYIGPEKLARIVKQGNTQLNRRYGY